MRFILEYFIKIVEKLKLMDKSIENRVLEKFLFFFMYQWVIILDLMVNSMDSWFMLMWSSDVDEDYYWGIMKLGMFVKLYVFVRNIQ